MGPEKVNTYMEDLKGRYPVLEEAADRILEAYRQMELCCRKGGKLLIGGNGGSCSDAQHIAAELMKGFQNSRPLPAQIRDKLKKVDPVRGERLASGLQGALPAIALDGHTALYTAFSNDVDEKLSFAQQVNGYGRRGDVFLAISTSGNSENILYAAVTARALGIKVIGFTGRTGGRLAAFSDILVNLPVEKTFMVQELQLPVYHCWCRMLEESFFGGAVS